MTVVACLGACDAFVPPFVIIRWVKTEILCITRTVEHNYISLSTVGIQLDGRG